MVPPLMSPSASASQTEWTDSRQIGWSLKTSPLRAPNAAAPYFDVERKKRLKAATAVTFPTSSPTRRRPPNGEHRQGLVGVGRGAGGARRHWLVPAGAHVGRSIAEIVRCQKAKKVRRRLSPYFECFLERFAFTRQWWLNIRKAK